MRLWAGRLCLLLAALLCSISAISAVRSNLWWIRVLDFPRFPLIALICAVAFGCAILAGRARVVAVSCLLIAGGWQFWRVHAYTIVAPPEMLLLGQGDPGRDCFKAVALNVLQSNLDHARTIRTLRRERPDVLLLMETDRRWLGALRPLLADYRYQIAKPIENYGMIFATNLRVDHAHFEDATGSDTPTLFARLETSNAKAFDFVGLHPRPPLPGQDTAERDRSIADVARREQGIPKPAVAMGDFNDVPWSHTSTTFKTVGGFRDPRIGRGPYATFPAKYVWLGWPLDQVFATAEFTVRQVGVLEDVGSDHRPLAAQFCL